MNCAWLDRESWISTTRQGLPDYTETKVLITSLLPHVIFLGKAKDIWN